MIKQKFKVGDLVESNRSRLKGRVNDIIYTTTIGARTRSEKIEYRLLNLVGAIPQECLRSIQPCPKNNCAFPGWDWEQGCRQCGMKPEDI